ncbi:hypothetical protein F0U44_09905 [Nocardioides humilatus]|uniref:DUF11 domain-containing protein n=1 Tax=Nocardioides humilatus TaxID=2607660 RepID=A0A5B1LDR7_9ACTN|nr:hypothetical protein [Nocardioides humilatus]KAA1418795.1 hypothetical protein F0U44_09905 [Nocardioides humilatus]
MSIPLRALAFLLACSLVGLPASPAQAASETAKLIIRGPGPGYTGIGGVEYPALVSEVVSQGASAGFEARVVNFGFEPAQFKIGIEGDLMPAALTLKAGRTDITASAENTPYYTTPVIQPGKYLQLTLRMRTPQTNLSGDSYAQAYLRVYSTDMALLSIGIFDAIIKAPAHGTSGAEVFARQGSRPYIGGNPHSHGTLTSPAIAIGETAKYTLKFQNDGTDSHRIRGELEPAFAECFDYTATQKRFDVTADLLEGTYLTPVLAPGRSVTVGVKVRWNGADCGAPYGAAEAYAWGPDNVEQDFLFLLTPLLATIRPPSD